MKFDQICRYLIKESYKDKFIAIADHAEKVNIPVRLIKWVANKPQVKIPQLSVGFLKRLVYDLKAELPPPDEVDKDNPESQFTNIDVMERIARKVITTFEVKETKGNAAALLIFRVLVQQGILKVIPWGKASRGGESEDERLAKAVAEPEFSEWGYPQRHKISPEDVPNLTGGYGPQHDEF